VATVKTVNIRPEVSVLSVFPHLNYKPWYAMAEFVDNALQSFLSHRAALAATEGERFKLIVEIEIRTTDGGEIIVRDNAAGIGIHDYQRAFKTASAPLDRSGLSEFGVGMKSAACWFAREWSVRTSALGEGVQRFITLDVESIVRDAVEEVAPLESPAPSQAHFTEITLRQLHSVPQGPTVAKIKEHLASIYRIFIRDGIMEIRFNKKESLTFVPPPVLSAPHYKHESEAPRRWWKEIDLDFGGGQRISGFAALRETASLSKAGFALFRRKRLIQGSGDEGYRPEYIFKKSNSFIYQRLFGELHVEGFEVTHTKDGFRWEEHEDIFLEYLKEQLNEAPLPLLDQATGHRIRLSPSTLQQGAQAAAKTTATALANHVPPVLVQQLHAQPDNDSVPLHLPTVAHIAERAIDIDVDGAHWTILITLTSDPAVGDWLSIGDQTAASTHDTNGSSRQLEISLSCSTHYATVNNDCAPDSIS